MAALSKPEVFVSIITVTFNAGKVLEKTIQSIIQQQCDDYEYIIVDGGSKDNTLEIIRKYEKHLNCWISEPDQGIYDAMNKGIKLAKGKYLWFMNAGDCMYASDTLLKICTHPEKEADIYYGETLMLTPEGQVDGLRSDVTPMKLPERLHWRSLQRGMVVCHQAFISKRSLELLYDFETHPYSADIDWVIRCLKKSKKTVNTQEILAIYLQGGFSKQHLKASLKDRFKILQKHYGLIPNLFNHGWIVWRYFYFKYLRKAR